MSRPASIALLALVVLFASRVWSIDYLILSPGNGSGPCTTTTTLPSCDTPGPNCDTRCDSTFCLAHVPDSGFICVWTGAFGANCDFSPNCASDADCVSGKYCVDTDGLGAGDICCPLCIPPPTTTTTTLPCSAPVYCRCIGDPGTCAGGVDDGNPCTIDADCPGGTCQKPSRCTVDADCPPNLFCQTIDTPPGELRCYRKTCSAPGGCNTAASESSCDVVCAAHGGKVATFCQNATCVGGTRDTEECYSFFGADECPSGTCTGPAICDCAWECRVTTSTVTSTTTTTTTTTMAGTTTTTTLCFSTDYCICVDDPVIPCGNDDDCPAGQSCQSLRCQHATCTAGDDCIDSGFSACDAVCVDLGGTSSAGCHPEVCDCTTTTTSTTTTTTM